MHLAVFALPARGDSGLQEDLNRFLRSHRVLTMHREFIAQGDNSFWALAVEYLEGVAPSGPEAGSGRGGKQRVDGRDLKGLVECREALGSRCAHGIVLYGGDEVLPLGSRIFAVPLSFLRGERIMQESG